MPSGTVKARLVRGRKALAPYLSEFADPGADPSGAKNINRQIVTGDSAREEGANHV